MQRTMQDAEKQPQKAQNDSVKTHEETGCCIVGAGPAGVMLALLLARKGVEVTLLEEHADFERDFRGDTVHPSTLELLAQIDLAEHVLQLEHTQAPAMVIETPQGKIGEISFRRLKAQYPYVAIISQARFLECLTQQARRYPSFHLIMGARAEKLVEEDGYVHGVQYRAQDGWHELRATLTVGTDGRFSRIRKLAGFEPVKTSQQMDVLWFRLPRMAGDPEQAGGRLEIGQGHIFVQLDRGDQWQIGYTFLKGSFQEIKSVGLESLRATIAQAQPAFAERMQGITEWKQMSVLSVESSILKRWYKPGLLLIGDAAHVMSPIGGVGINYAIQDAVATANILTDDLKVGKAPTGSLARVQRRRELPTRLIQGFQRFLQRQIHQGLMTTKGTPKPPFLFKLALHTPLVRSIMAQFIGFGPLRERVKNP